MKFRVENVFQSLRDKYLHFSDVVQAAWKERNQSIAKGFGREEREFLPAAIEIQETPPSPVYGVMLKLIMALFTIAILWACIGRIDISVSAPGEFVVSSRVKQIQPLETARVRSIYVEEGQKVQEGDPLLAFDTQPVEAERALVEVKLAQGKNTLFHARSLLFQILPEASEKPGQEPESFQKKERELLLSALMDFKSQKKSFETKHDEIVARNSNLQARIETINSTLPITSQLAADTKELAAKGSSSKHDFMRLEQERLKLLGELKDAEISLQENEERLKSSTAEQEAFASGFLHKLRESISESAYQIQQAEQEWNRINYREKNMLLTSPVAGTIYQLGVHTVGAIAQSGQTTMLVVPENDTLEVVVEIKSKDVGFLQVGQNAEVKVDAYPYVRHGSYKGVIVQISPDTIKTGDQANKEKPFLCTLKTRSDISQPQFSVLPGMSVLAEIKTGSRSVVSYVLSPLSEALDASFKER